MLLAKNRVKLLLNMLLIAGQTIPRGGKLTVDPVGSKAKRMGFKVSAAGANAKVPPAVAALLTGETGGEALDAHRIQPFYAGMLAQDPAALDARHGHGRRDRRRHRSVNARRQASRRG